MTLSSVSTSKCDSKKRPAENSYQSSRSRYLRAFASARAMRFWRPRVVAKELGVAAVLATAIAMGPSATQAQFPASFDLSTLDGTNGFVINGVNANMNLPDLISGQSGFSVSGAGDVNGDGIDDLIIGAIGESYVVFGNNGSFPSSLDLNTLDGTNGFVMNTDGISVSGAGDVNGDGIDDLIIGNSLAEPNGNSRSGQSFVVFGTNSGFSSSLDLSTLDGTNGFVINGGDSSDRSGESVSGAGDVNGDGVDDLIIGAHGVDPNGNSQAGASYVVFGSNSGFSSSLDLSTLDGTNGFVINGIDVNDRSGDSVSGLGDFNGDGFDDLIIGAPAADRNGISYAGESYVVFGNSGGFSSSLDLSTLNGSNGFVINGIDFRDFSGSSVSGAGDVNGDGFDDLIIDSLSPANLGRSFVVLGNNSGFLPSLDLSTLDGSNGFVINGINTICFNAISVSCAGDANGDGIDDIIIGAALGGPNGVFGVDPNATLGAGQSYVVFGTNSGFASSLDLSTLDGTNGFLINGIDVGDEAGTSVSSAGDVNGDGIDDLIIGARYGDPNGNMGAGESYVVFGRAASSVIKGDVDMDGDIDFSDIAPFIAVLQSGVFQAEADCDCSTVVDFADIPAFIALLQQQ